MTLVFLQQAIGIGAILAILYWWTGLGEGSVNELAFSSVVLISALTAFGWLAWRAVKRLREIGGITPWGFPRHVLMFVLTCGFAYWIVWWIPQVESVRGQVVSMLIRFGLGYFVAVAGWTGLLRAIASGRPRANAAGDSRTI